VGAENTKINQNFREYYGDIMNKESVYSSFNSIPWKLIRAGNIFPSGKIKPLHIRLYPTNRCNASCGWCCYSDRDKSLELGISEIKKIIKYFSKLGTKAITFSGGGEPTLHPNIKDMLEYAKKKKIECGIVTNGLLWGKENVNLDFANKVLTWARISVIETIGSYDVDRIVNFANNLDEVDVGISFVVPKGVNIPLAKKICEIASITDNIKHVKFIQDSFVLNDKSMQLVIDECSNLTEKAFFIWRDVPSKGHKDCRVSLLKPVVDAAGYVYPCCDVQHSGSTDVRYMPDRYRMCYWEEFDQTNIFNGSNCNKCYYGMYNDFLEMMIKESDHDTFL